MSLDKDGWAEAQCLHDIKRTTKSTHEIIMFSALHFCAKGMRMQSSRIQRLDVNPVTH